MRTIRSPVTSETIGVVNMAAIAIDGPDSPDETNHRGVLLRMLDALAEWQMRQLLRIIVRRQALKATMTGVTQPSSANERSSIIP
jgi:hypothetical protein